MSFTIQSEKMKTFVTILFLLLSLRATSQSLGLQQIGNLGGEIQSGNGPALRHSMGATAGSSIDQGTIRLDQGMFVPCDLKCGGFADNIEKSLNAENILQVFPNPTDGALFLRSKSKAPVHYELWSIQGQLLHRRAIDQSQVSLADLPTGMYLLAVYDRDDALLFQGKVIKQ